MSILSPLIDMMSFCSLSLEVFRIWVVHPEYSSNEEKDGMAMVPSWVRTGSAIFKIINTRKNLVLWLGKVVKTCRGICFDFVLFVFFISSSLVDFRLYSTTSANNPS